MPVKVTSIVQMEYAAAWLEARAPPLTVGIYSH